MFIYYLDVITMHVKQFVRRRIYNTDFFQNIKFIFSRLIEICKFFMKIHLNTCYTTYKVY